MCYPQDQLTHAEEASRAMDMLKREVHLVLAENGMIHNNDCRSQELELLRRAEEARQVSLLSCLHSFASGTHEAFGCQQGN